MQVTVDVFRKFVNDLQEKVMDKDGTEDKI